MDSSELNDRYFNENEVFYDIRVRNKALVDAQSAKGGAEKSQKPIKQQALEATEQKAVD